MRKHIASLLIVISVSCMGAWVPRPAHAQGALSGGGTGGPFLSHGAQPFKKHEAAPPSVPGAASNPATVAPPDKTVGELKPNEALFDAINRGDLGAARDAISRGADLEARNVLGLTPLDLSVDLARNDISFLLLSLRGAAPVRQPGDLVATSARPPMPKPARKAPAAARLAVAHAAPVQPQTPRLFAGDGGTPQPDHGFLGFGTVSSTQ